MKRIAPLMSVTFCILGAGAFAQQQSITLPAGTAISISTIDRINSKKADTHREYAANVDDPVVVDGVTVIPAKTSAFLRVSDIKSAGYKRRASLNTSLAAVMINGQRVEVNTGKIDSESGSQVKRTVTGTAVGAGTGAAIGGAIGGGAGAGIGAGIGAAGGAVAGKVFGKAVEIAPETRFTYTLSQPVVIDSPGPAPAAQQSGFRRAPEAPASAAGVPHPEFVGAVYFQDRAGSLVPLERTRANERRDDRGESWYMDGAQSPVRLPLGQKMTFVVQLANGIDPGTYALLPLEARTDGRWTRADLRNRNAPLSLPVNVTKLGVTKLGDSIYGLTPAQELAAGEYAFSPSNSNNAYCFGVDALPDRGADRPAEPGRSPGFAEQASPSTTPSGTGAQIPAGTLITVRMIDKIDSNLARLGQTFRAGVDEPVVVDGQTAIPRGADALVKLVEDQQSGKFEGKTILTLALTDITISNEAVDTTTTGVSRASSSRGARTAKVVGGATVLGAIIGALAGGGRGAAIGAASGAAVGGAAQVITKGQQVKIPSETRLNFTLQQPIEF